MPDQIQTEAEPRLMSSGEPVRLATLKPGRFGWWHNGLVGTAARVVFFALSVGLGFLLLEIPWNQNINEIEAPYAVLNLAILSLLCGFTFFLGQRTRVSLAVFVGLCLFAGIANFYIINFKGQPILPADMFALSTAFSVAGGYRLFLTSNLVACIALYVIFCELLVLLCPARRITRNSFVVNCLIVFAIAVFCYAQYSSIDIKNQYNVEVGNWFVKESYASQGTALCFISRVQELAPEEPEGYSLDALEGIMIGYSDDDALSDGSFKGPNIIVVMNETFSDLSIYPGLENSNAAPSFFQEVAADSLVSGAAYVSVIGGNTCNSEFEFLTGASLGNMSAGAHPYVLYDLDSVDNLATYFKRLGYSTCAIHPSEASNWRRDRVYEQLGFDSFDDITTMEDADTLRNLVTDKATYERVLEKIDDGSNPQFIFDVTIQNHGGYFTGMVPPEEQVQLNVDLVQSEELDEYLSIMKCSDEDLKWFIEQLNECDEPCILVFFGDHQPSFADWLFAKTYGENPNDTTLQEEQVRYQTPYFIWANNSARHDSSGISLSTIGSNVDTSLNYLGNLLVESVGLPSTAKDKLLSSMRTKLPAMNVTGYMDSTGVWHWFEESISSDEQQEAEDALKAYRIVQYSWLFG